MNEAKENIEGALIISRELDKTIAWMSEILESERAETTQLSRIRALILVLRSDLMRMGFLLDDQSPF